MSDNLREMMQGHRSSPYVFANTGHWGESVDYTPFGGSEVTITGEIERLDAIDQEFEDGRHLVARLELTISNQVTVGIVAPGPKDTIDLDSQTWTFFQLVRTTASSHTIEFRNIGPIEKSAGEYRINR